MRRRSTTVMFTAFTIAASGMLAACGSRDSSSGATASSEGGKPLDGVTVTVGSKDFTENILLGEILGQVLAQKGATVNDKTNLGGTSVNRQALVSGDINVYPEYNGTGWTVHLKQQDPSQDPTELTDKTSAMDLKDNKIAWVGQSPFNDTYGFAANGDLAKKEGEFDFQKMADYLKANASAKLCLETEFPDRPDGLVLFEKATGYTVPKTQITILDTGLIYTETAKGSCQFGEVFTTDGRIQALNLSLVKDPGVMILYNVSYTFQDDLYQAHAATYDDVVAKILEPLDNTKMAELNAKVDVDGDDVKIVAKDYLKSIGLS
ncbi:MAG: glycine betaine ABC transporter substrate-binding protein [Nostocoides sp.]